MADHAVHSRGREPTPVAGERFLQTVQACPVQQHPAVGRGEELHSTSPQIVGSVLVFEGCAIHAAFFDVGGVDGAGQGARGQRERPEELARSRDRQQRHVVHGQAVEPPRPHRAGRGADGEDLGVCRRVAVGLAADQAAAFIRQWDNSRLAPVRQALDRAFRCVATVFVSPA